MNDMATWVAEMLKWVEENRPGDIEIFRQVFSKEGNASAALALMGHVGFEAGRKYQHDNPKAELGPIV